MGTPSESEHGGSNHPAEGLDGVGAGAAPVLDAPEEAGVFESLAAEDL